MKKYIKKSKFKDPFCTVYLFRRFFIIVSLTGFIITILNIEPKEYKNIYNDILQAS